MGGGEEGCLFNARSDLLLFFLVFFFFFIGIVFVFFSFFFFTSHIPLSFLPLLVLSDTPLDPIKLSYYYVVQALLRSRPLSARPIEPMQAMQRPHAHCHP
jgi:hypothetical protein